MLKLFHSIFTSSSGKSAKLEQALVERAIERVVDGTDTRFRAVIGYRKRLRSAVQRAVEYVIDLADDLPPAVEFSKRQYGTDPKLRAFFATADRLQEVLSNSQAIQSYLSQGKSPATGMINAALGIERLERRVLGMELAGDILRRDVEQVVVNFSKHRFAALSDSETATRWEVKKRGFDNLIQTALQQLVSVRTKREGLAQERQQLGSKLQALRDGCWGLESLLEQSQPRTADTAAVEKRIAEIDAELGQIKTKPLNLDDYLGVVAATLGAPQEHLRMDAISLTLDHMGVKVAADSRPSVDTLRLNEFSTSDGRHAIVLLVAIPWGEIQQPSSDPFEEASRYL